MERLEMFRRSSMVLQDFFSRWLVRLGERCRDKNRLQAAYCVWARYSMSMRTLEVLLDPHLLPDVSVICRGCLEFKASLMAVLKDDELACDYLEYGKHAHASYLKLLGKQGDIDRMLKRREQFDEMYSEDPDNLGRTSWCVKKGGITGLMRWLGWNYEHRLYNMLSHFAHGSIAALNALEASHQDPVESLASMIDSTYLSFLKASYQFIETVWEPLLTPEGEQCKTDFRNVMSSYT